ncbi:hypothetical protein [Leuconostoc citreum]
MEDRITISKSELERLVAIEIAKQAFPRTRHDFSGVMINDLDVLKVNEQHPVIKEKLKHTYTTSIGNNIHYRELRGFGRHDKSIFSRNRHVIGYDQWSHTKVYTTDVHQTLRKLSVQVMGGTIMKDLASDELDFALDVYEDFKRLFLEKYNQRLSSEEMTED